ncbi:hypothetical protein ACGFIR_15505 [Micromonospora sp. NPDC049051]|uniref:hypothetical protein n=1 Tax=Micromonospora sp. NPDC049051 TaxID=3364264 RepID=UPI0037193CBB
MTGLIEEISHLCQVWGGSGHPLLPVTRGQVPEAYAKLLETQQVDHVGGLQEVEVRLPRRVGKRAVWDYPVIVLASTKSAESWRPIQIAELDPTDPWNPIYAATLGVWPSNPSERLTEFASLKPGLRFEDIFNVVRERVSGSLEDLLARLNDERHMSPRQLSNVFLAAGSEPDTSYIATDSVIPRPNSIRRAAGPNVIVAVSPGSVEDVALLWNLRAAHGDRRALPIGLPIAEISAKALKQLSKPGIATMFGLSGGKCHITSASLSISELQSLTAGARNALCVKYEDLVTFGYPPARPRSQVALWRDGRAKLDALSDSDREILNPTLSGFRQPSMVLDVYVSGHPIPADPTMRGGEFFARFQAGAAQVSVSPNRERTVEVCWPPTWTCLAAVAQSRKLKVAPSEAGLAASTLIESIGDVDGIRWLLHRPLIHLLYEVGERSGMSWWRQRWTRTHRELMKLGADPQALETAAQDLGRDDPAVAPAGEGRAVPYQKFRQALGNEAAAKRWVTWAESRHLLVRGTNITCPYCSSSSWLPMASLPPPVGCPGCGRTIDQPYGARELLFTYRIGEPLRRVLETDSLGHILALRWLTELLDGHGLVGAHPGVRFIDPETNLDIGEADVLLLFSDGSLVPVEVKRRIGGTSGRAVELLDTLADAIQAPYDLVAVTEPARECESLTQLAKSLPDRPRLLLTDDQLFDDFVVWSLGSNPFAWRPRTKEEDSKREAKFVRRLLATDPDAPRDFATQALLETSDSDDEMD